MARDKILIVDDEQDFITLLKLFFEKKGYEVIAALTGSDALKKAKEAPHIILLDVNLPDMKGFEVLNTLRADSANVGIPIIMLTASASSSSINEAQDLHATDYIIKTESFERILAIVQKYIAQYKHKYKSMLRKSGIDVLGDITWGKHICAFYGSKEDLLGILAPYFKTGLLNNELCFWSLSEGLKVKDVITALRKEMENFSAYIEKGQMNIIDGGYLYDGNVDFDQERVINFWAEEEKNALEHGFDGLRISGSVNWAWGPKWEVLYDYEKGFHESIGKKKIIAVCTYSFYKFSMPEIMATGAYHSIVVAKQGDKAVSFAPTSEETFLKYFDKHGKSIKD